MLSAMKIEAFSESRDPDRPDANEDAWLVVPGGCLAVIDGVTDRTGSRFDGATSGRIASRAVAAALKAFVEDPAERAAEPRRLVAALSGALRAEYARYGLLEATRSDRSRRFGATLAAAIEIGDVVRFIRIGDSGIRIDGRDVRIEETRVDRMTSSIRQAVYAHLAAEDATVRAQVARVCVLNGLGSLHPEMGSRIDEKGRFDLRADALERARRAVPEAEEADLIALVDGGVVRGQVRYTNVDRPPFGYGVLDGYEVPDGLIACEDRPRNGLRSIELFTDGYFKIPDAVSLAAWEAAFAEVEREDPEKIGRYPAPKGSVGRMRTDDRTVIVAKA